MIEDILKETDISNVHIGKIHAFIDCGRAFLLSEIGTSILMEEDLYQALKRKECPEELLMKLIQRGFARVEGSLPVEEKEIKILPNFFMITLTNNCNMRCKYCFHQFLPEHAAVLSEEMLDKILEYIITYVKENQVPKAMIQAWGGEPFLCMNLLEKMYEKLERSQIAYKICLETNGTLLTKDVVDKLNDMKIDIGISVDGVEEIQNKQRPLANGGESASYVYQGIQNVQEANTVRFGSISVVTKDVLKNLEENITYFAKKGMTSIKMNVARVSKEQKIGLNAEEVEEYAERLVNQMVLLTEQGYHITEGNVVDRLKNLIRRNESNICNSHGCQGGKRMVSFDTKGNIYPCEMTDYPEECLGNIEKDKDLIALIRNRQGRGYFTPKDLTVCKDCPFLYYCGGGCTTAIIYKKGKVEGVDELGCVFNKAMYCRLIQLILEKPEIAEKMIEGGR